MSAAAVQTPVQEVRTLSLVTENPPVEAVEPGFSDAHPIVTVGIFIAISLSMALVFISFFAIWLYGIRDSGVMAR
ncbi:MAG: hypothetical protein ACM3SW_13615 [Actinomycetota bacterium]